MAVMKGIADLDTASQDPQDQTDQTSTRRTFPEDIWRQLDGIDLKILDWLCYLSKKQGERSPGGAKYCFPGRKFLAGKIGVSVWTISRHISKLKRLGILSAYQRRPKGGRWQTNLYRVINWLGWRIGQILSKFRSNKNGVRLNQHIASQERNSSPQRGGPPQKLADNPLIQAWMKRGTAVEASK